jgi:ABC-type dipeptide/oligopeptide/nickel transport system permease component
MWRYVLLRLGVAIVQLAALAVVVFFLIRLLPADPVARLVGLNASPEAYAQSQRALGLDRPLIQQFAAYLGLSDAAPGLLQGELGRSWVTGEPVTAELGRALPLTIEVVSLALLASLLIAIPVGLVSAAKPKGVVDRAAFVWGLFAGAQPDYWWGLLFILLFAFTLGLAPAPLGRVDPLLIPPDSITGFILLDSLLQGRFDVFVSALHYLALPVLTMVFTVSGAIVKMVRQNTARALQSEYVLYARACGLPERRVARYALRAALTPTLTLIGIFFSVLLSAAVTVERVFSLNGVGQYSVRSILDFDYPAIQGAVLAVAMVALLVYLLVDIVHALLDPRLRG